MVIFIIYFIININFVSRSGGVVLLGNYSGHRRSPFSFPSCVFPFSHVMPHLFNIFKQTSAHIHRHHRGLRFILNLIKVNILSKNRNEKCYKRLQLISISKSSSIYHILSGSYKYYGCERATLSRRNNTAAEWRRRCLHFVQRDRY